MGAKYSVGQQIQHKRFVYRGVIVGVDPVFLGTDSWYEQMAISKPPKNAPWYHVLVHEADHATYVAERNLLVYEGTGRIDHPSLSQFFIGFDAGRYLVQEE